MWSEASSSDSDSELPLPDLPNPMKTTLWSIVIAATPGYPPEFIRIEPWKSNHNTYYSRRSPEDAHADDVLIPSLAGGPLSFMFGSKDDPIFKSPEISQLEQDLAGLDSSDDECLEIKEKLRKLKASLPPLPNKIWNANERKFERVCMQAIEDTSGHVREQGIWTQTAFTEAVNREDPPSE